ncbi:MAG: hypothetical protein QM817_29255 [Archangium sp.]
MAIEQPASRGWLISPAHDLVFYSGLTLASAVVVLALGRVVAPLTLFVWFNLVLTVGHYAPTWMRAFLDREEFKTHRTSILLFPVLFAVVALATRGRPEVLAVLIYLWDRFHAVMQNYGFTRLYDARAGAKGSKGFTELTLLFSSALALMSFNQGLLAPFLNLLRTVSIPVPASVEFVWALRAVALTVLTVALTRYALEQRQRRKEGTFSVGKQVFLVLLTAGHLLMNVTTNVFLLSCHEKVYHSVQYVVLVWHFNRRRAQQKPGELTSPMRALFATPKPYLYFLGIGTFIGVVAFAFQGEGEGLLFTRLGSAVALTHYYFDSFLWRVRREQVRVNL